MSQILDTIIAAKRKEVELLKQKSSIRELEKEGPFWLSERRSLKNKLLDKESSGLIAEFKRKSPSKGWFKDSGFEIGPVVKAYAEGGASGLSVLTDQEFFGGSIADLEKTRNITDVPVLRKEFIIDEWQIAESRARGADAILLIAACLQKGNTKQMAAFARSLDLEVLLELHDESELDHVGPDVDMVGINNRDLRTFKVDIDRSLKMADKIPDDFPKIAESGIHSETEIRVFREHGYRGFLIGETFMKETDPGQAFQKFRVKLDHLLKRR